MTSGRTSGTEYFCSFCSEGEQQAGRLIAGPGSGYICENCIKNVTKCPLCRKDIIGKTTFIPL